MAGGFGARKRLRNTVSIAVALLGSNFILTPTPLFILPRSRDASVAPPSLALSLYLSLSLDKDRDVTSLSPTIHLASRNASSFASLEISEPIL